jgi:hypothetical protein
MKLLAGGFVGLFILLFVMSPKPASAQEATPNIWEGTTTITELGDRPLQTMLNRPDCEFKNVKAIKPIQPFTVVFGNPIFLFSEQVEIGSSCVISNSQGSFAAPNFTGNVPTQRIGYYSGTNNPSKMYTLNNSNASVYLDPAPTGDKVLMISGINGTLYRLTLIDNFTDISKISLGGQLGVEWRFDVVAENFKNAVGSNIGFSKHAYSSNGRYLAVRYGNILGKIDLQTLTLTPVEYRLSWPSSFEIAISNNGRNVAVLGNGLYVFDTSNCSSNYAYGSWDNANQSSNLTYPGCVKSRDFRSELVSSVPTDYTFLYRLYFEQNSASINIGAGKRVISSSDSLPQRFSWKEFNIKADSYSSNANGYIALGDSFSSGEGDLQGGTWYEPGTDEQGNKDTFEGRNLCHLSRRSYPYLIAKELGYLTGTADQPVSPTADGLFHSVACSGAKEFNIIGTKLGPRLEPGNEEDFKIRENQYRNDYFGILNEWQPGRIKQFDYFIGENTSVSRSEQSPSVITIGIGGNDGGFGDTIQACILPGTCDQAVSGSPASGMLATKIAEVKPKLVDVYEAVKLENSEARIYVHGYPKFAQAGGDCGLNVRLDAQEVVMANEGVVYMNAVVKSAALEAGVFYVDVTDVLINRNLCSLAPEDQKAFNGVTAGNDISNIYINIGSNGLCLIRSGCFGKETFHPNKFGHELYKKAIMAQTNNLQALMPAQSKQPYPIPSDFFGAEVQSRLISTNISDGLMSDTILIPVQKPLISQGSTGELKLNQTDLLPGSQAELIVYSEPTLIGIYDVPESGFLTSEFNLPVDLPIGVHEIHLKGLDRYGEQVDYYESIIVGYSNIDFDGDGIANSVDKCPSVVNSNIDIDRDGTDDVCDAEAIPFVEPPPPPPPPVEPPKQTTIQKLFSLLKRIVKVLLMFFR